MKINKVSDLGDNWQVLGLDKSSSLKLPLGVKKWVVVVRLVKISGGVERNKILLIGNKKFLVSVKGAEIWDSINDIYPNDEVSVCPVPAASIVSDIYNEWGVRVKNDTYLSSDGKSGGSEHSNIREAKNLIFTCLEDGVSDLHLEVRERSGVIRVRRNAALVDYMQLTNSEGMHWGNTLYQVLAQVGSSTFDPSVIQDGMFDQTHNGVRCRGRIATSPVLPGGFDLTVRLLKIQTSTELRTLESMNYTPSEIKKINIAKSRPSGLILLGGTTGSGKSTTIQQMLMELVYMTKGTKKIITIEDPVEYFIPRTTQISVVRDNNGDASDSFNGAIRTAMRQDPDIIMIGEIRDSQSAKLAQSAIKSGHPVYSTVHTQSAVSSIGRLQDLGMERESLSSQGFLSGTFYQKLIPLICQSCAREAENGMVPVSLTEDDIIINNELLTMAELKDFRVKYAKDKLAISNKVSFIRYMQDLAVVNALQANTVVNTYSQINSSEKRRAAFDRIKSVSSVARDKVLFRGTGCTKCKGTGIVGRIPVTEGMNFNIDMLSIIASGDEKELTQYWRKNMGGKFAIEDGILKMNKGLLDPLDLEKELGYLDASF